MVLLHKGSVTSRDQKLFQFLFENKVATARQVTTSLFPKVRHQNIYRRLGKLVRAGWIDKLGYFNGDQLQHLYCLSEHGFRQFVHQEDKNDRRLQLMSDVVEHDLALADIRIRMEALSEVKNYFTENVLQSNHDLASSKEFKPFIQLRSDAVVELILQGGKRFIVPLEYEASLKSKERCQKKLLDYYIQYEGGTALFICQSEPVLKRMVQMDREISREFKSKMYFALLADVLDVEKKMTFRNHVTDKRIVF